MVFRLATVSVFGMVSVKNRYFCHVSQQVLSEVVALQDCF